MRINLISVPVFLAVLFSAFSTNSHATEVSLRDKIGQMIIIGFDGKSVNHSSAVAKAITKNNVGGVILFDYNFKTQTFDRNIESPEQVRHLNQQLQDITQQANKAHHRPNLPLFISVDYEGGQVNRLHERYGFPSVPSPKKIGEGSLAEAHDRAGDMAQVLDASGFNLNYFPTLDVDVNPDNPIIGALERSFSAQPELVSHYAQQYSNQLLDRKIQCAYKHFPGHGSSIADSHLGFVDVTNTWSDKELMPYMNSFAQPKPCGMVMVAHIVNRQLDLTGAPATLSAPTINGLLRHDLGFDGVVVSDDMQMKAIADYYGLETALTRSINAGVDMLIFGNQLSDEPQDVQELIDIIEEKVRSGEIPEERIDESYQRIIVMKQEMGERG